MTYQPTHLNKLPDNRILRRNKAKNIAPYVFNDDILIAIDVALATDRPLLVSGKPGSGKSRLADAIAAVQGWNFLSRTMTSRTRLEQLTAEIDHLRRLNDAQTRSETSELKPDAWYHNPGILWWAFNPESATRRGMSDEELKRDNIALEYPGIQRKKNLSHNVVLLIDEIDKAEPDLPNDLLEPLDRRSFGLPDGDHIEGNPDISVITVITTNGERDLPGAFLRRCITLELPDPGEAELKTIALQHFPTADKERVTQIATLITEFRERAQEQRIRPPGTSEFLDTIRACEDLNIEIDSHKDSVWSKVKRAVLIKEADR